MANSEEQVADITSQDSHKGKGIPFEVKGILLATIVAAAFWAVCLFPVETVFRMMHRP